MNYRSNPRTHDKISEIGFGSAYIFESGFETAVKTIRHAYEGGINYFDMAGAIMLMVAWMKEPKYTSVVKKRVLESLS